MPPKLPLVPGTLDLLVLGALSGGARHGYGIATVIEERTHGALEVEDGALYQALHRLDRDGLVDSEWRPSENNRRARYYALSTAGRRRLRQEALTWRRYSKAVEAVLQEA
ncbi:MAG TPA: PadR family transcriptional regulator [Thermoanaerobaculia bacterium]|nr:PadR family transcriptional regulator [Thermoanaerobaculia bacterium]